MDIYEIINQRGLLNYTEARKFEFDYCNSEDFGTIIRLQK